MQIRKFYGLVLVAILLGISSLSAQDNRIRFNAFGDMSFGGTFGSFASDSARAQFEQFGTDAFPLSTVQGFGIVGVDFIATMDLTEALIFQTEINLQVERGGSGEIELDMERLYLDYRFRNALNFQIGLYFTPIGFTNRNLYARAWLMKSIQIRDIVEESLGLVPSHTIGVNAYGVLLSSGGHSLNYIVSAGNGRGVDPLAVTFARDETRSKEFTGLLEWVAPGFRDFRVGISGWTDEINSYKVGLGETVDMEDPSTEAMKLRETGFNPYFVMFGNKFDFLAEYHASWMKDKLGTLGGKTFKTTAFTAEFALHFSKNKLHPYVRYDVTKLPENGGPFFGLREGDGIFRGYIPEFKAVMIGAAYDLFGLNRVKVEYIHHFDGPRKSHGIAFQTAFGF